MQALLGHVDESLSAGNNNRGVGDQWVGWDSREWQFV